MIRRLLVANRGEIAVRVARGARELGIAPLGVYSEADAGAYHLQAMDESLCIGPAPAAQSYLDIPALLAAAKTLRADAVHPGYGFLSERAEFARAVTEAGLTFVGPPAEAMAAMGSKIEAKRRVRRFDVPVVPGYEGEDQSPQRLREEARRIGTPLLIKASAGGGGRGMRVVDDLAHFDEALDAAKREALAAFGNDTVLLERYLQRPRHIEFQILADAHGRTIHLGERECSIQRRHQKILEEAPSVALSPELRAAMGAAAVRAAQSVGYVNAGTCEFMLDADGQFYFLEMNTRLQVEHPVTELVYGVDLVQWQLRIAAGEPLTLEQPQVQPRGWAIETRVYAEDPANQFLPSTGSLDLWEPPEGPGIRVDSGVSTGSEVSVYYDPMLAKLIVWAETRAAAVRRLTSALERFCVSGARTNIPLLLWIARDEAFRAGETTTAFLAERMDESAFTPPQPGPQTLLLALAAILYDGHAPWRIAGVGMPLRLRCGAREFAVEADAAGPHAWRLRGDAEGLLCVDSGAPHVQARFDDTPLTGRVQRVRDAYVAYEPAASHTCTFAPPLALEPRARAAAAPAFGRIASPMPGKIVKVAVREGDAVNARDLLLVLEAMKMEHRIEAPGKGIVKALFVREGEMVASAAPLIEVE